MAQSYWPLLNKFFAIVLRGCFKDGRGRRRDEKASIHSPSPNWPPSRVWHGIEVGNTMKIDKANIEQFIREKVEIDSLTDAQIARLLNVGTSTISHWRNKFNIRPADKFKRKFKEKYGSDALQSFDMMVKNRTTLQEIANYFGFTREYARQVYNKLYNGSYSDHLRQRRYR
jgi:transposase